MKTIISYINEQLLNNSVKSLLENTLKNINFNEFKSFAANDPDRFDISKENENLFIQAFKDNNLKAISTAEYYESLNNNLNFDDLSAAEKANFDAENGDIILIDENETPKYFIDLKISDKFLGAVSMGSLTKFNENGIYVCICSSTGNYKIVSHKELYNLVKNDTSLINAAVNKYKGYKVTFEGKEYMSEDFIKGKTIENLK